MKNLSHDKKKCPFCAEIIKKDAVVCRFCGLDLNTGKPAGVDVSTSSGGEQKIAGFWNYFLKGYIAGNVLFKKPEKWDWITRLYFWRKFEKNKPK